MERYAASVTIIGAALFLFACAETKNTDTDEDAFVDLDETETDADVDTARVLTQRRILGEGGFYGISSSEGNDDYFAVGAHYAELSATPGENPSGKVYLYKKGTVPTAFTDAETVLTHPDARPGAGFGYTIGGYCDLNCDGAADFAVSAHLDSVGTIPNCGTIALFFGGENPDPATAVLSLPDGVRKQSDVMGQSLVCFDTDGDGCDDLIAGGQNAGPNDTGLIAVWKGAAGGPAAEPAFYMEAQVTENKQYLGASLAVGDVDGDGKSDLVAGGWGLKKDAESANTGGVYLYKGGDDWSQGPSATLFPDKAVAQEVGFGSKVILFHVDGVTYVAVMAPDYNQGAGAVFIYYFASGAFQSDAQFQPSMYDDPVNGISDIAFSPDFGGKGKGALLIGHKYYGADSTGAITALPFPPETASVLITAEPPVPGDTFGAMVKDIGDINGDGLADIAVGTPEHIEGDFETGTQPGGIVLLY